MIPWHILLVIFAGIVAIAATPAGASVADAVARALTIIGRRDWLAMLFVATVAFLAAMLPSLVWSVPVPVVHDEFSYLLAGDTFAHGRLTNPPLPDDIWPSFEMFHVIQRPTYASKFPPGQGLVLAAGEVLTGRPIVGVWLSFAAACAAIVWLLRGALPPRFAILGGLLVAIHPAVFWWSQTYWGGAVATLGGAMFGGAALRWLRAIESRASIGSTVGPAGSLAQRDVFPHDARPTAGSRSANRAGPSPGRDSCTNGIIAGIGAAILANSRPFEGLILIVLVGALLLTRAIARRQVVHLFARLVFPAALVLIPVAAFMLYYNRRVTGDALTLPDRAYQRASMAAPRFFWQPWPQTPHYQNEQFRQFHVDVEAREFRDAETINGRLAAAKTLLGFAYPVTFLLPLLALPWAVRRRWRRGGLVAAASLAVCLALPAIELTAVPWMRLAYMGPVVGFFTLAVTVGLQRLARAGALGRAVMAAVIVTQLIVIVPWAARLGTANAASSAARRAALVRGLRGQPGKQLVFVRYGPQHDSREEWVANGADLDNAPVIFARALDADRDRRVARHFADRRLWLLDINDSEPPRLQPLARP